MMMMMMMMTRLAQAPMLCVRIYNMKLAMMQKTHFLKHVFSTYEDGRRQARANGGVCPYYYYCIVSNVDYYFPFLHSLTFICVRPQAISRRSAQKKSHNKLVKND